jgi:two-component system, NtrC family, sensor kinase
VAHILVVEDDADYGRILHDTLQWGGHTPLVTKHASTAIGVLKLRIPDVVVLDLRLADEEGFAVIDALRKATTQRVPVIAVSGDPDLLERARRDTRLRRVFPKPCDFGSLLKEISDAVASAKEHRHKRGDDT